MEFYYQLFVHFNEVNYAKFVSYGFFLIKIIGISKRSASIT